MSFKKASKQILRKPAKLARFAKFSSPKQRKFGRSINACSRCGKTEGVITKYGLNYCRQCFRESAEKLGFKKYS